MNSLRHSEHKDGHRSVAVLHPSMRSSNGIFYNAGLVALKINTGDKLQLGGGVVPSCSYDLVIPPFTDQENVYVQTTLSLVEALLDGETGTSSGVICTGSSGSGKTFVTTGGPEHQDLRGLIPRAATDLFKFIKLKRQQQSKSSHTFDVWCSNFEIGGDMIVDLLPHEGPREAPLESALGLVLSGPLGAGGGSLLHKEPAENDIDIWNALFRSDSRRSFEKTATNKESSRGHNFFVIGVTRRCEGEVVSVRTLTIVDLASVVPGSVSIAMDTDALRGVWLFAYELGPMSLSLYPTRSALLEVVQSCSPFSAPSSRRGGTQKISPWPTSGGVSCSLAVSATEVLRYASRATM